MHFLARYSSPLIHTQPPLKISPATSSSSSILGVANKRWERTGLHIAKKSSTSCFDLSYTKSLASINVNYIVSSFAIHISKHSSQHFISTSTYLCPSLTRVDMHILLRIIMTHLSTNIIAVKLSRDTKEQYLIWLRESVSSVHSTTVQGSFIGRGSKKVLRYLSGAVGEGLLYTRGAQVAVGLLRFRSCYRSQDIQW